jgi:hypothetical protein
MFSQNNPVVIGLKTSKICKSSLSLPIELLIADQLVKFFCPFNWTIQFGPELNCKHSENIRIYSENRAYG